MVAGHYLDHAATSSLRAVAREAMIAQLDHVGNPNAVHRAGRAGRKIVDDARERVADAVICRPAEVIFTAGGTEADNLAVKGIFWAVREQSSHRDMVVTAATEHHAVLDAVDWLGSGQGAQVLHLPLAADGRLDMTATREQLSTHASRIALVSIMWANNETGVIHPIAELARLCTELGIYLHIDATQAVGHVPVDFAATGCAALTISAHKLGGPVGAGALILRTDVPCTPVHHGGGQERKVRSGTLDPALLAGFGAAATASTQDLQTEARRLAAMRNDAAQRLSAAIPDLRVTGPDPAADDLAACPSTWLRLPHILHVSLTGCTADALIFLLDFRNIYVSAGSACTSGIQSGSHVTRAMGVEPERLSAGLRISCGHDTTQCDIDALCEALPEVVAQAKE